MKKRARIHSLAFLLLFLPILAVAQDESDDDVQRAKDERTIQVLSRLSSYDLDAKPKVKAVVLRHLKRIKGTSEFLEIVEKFKVKEVSADLVLMAAEKPAESIGVNSARLLVKFDQVPKLADQSVFKDESTAQNFVLALSKVGGNKVTELMKALVGDGKVTITSQTHAVQAIGKSKGGQGWLLEKVKDGALDERLNFPLANILLSSSDPSIQNEAKKFLALPETADSKPLPALKELVAMKGKIELGKKAFETKGTCAKCHQVNGAGKNVGPDLSEIGSKLSREAMFVSILNPSEGISHNYESYLIETIDGITESGLLVSKTDKETVLKNSEGIVRKFPQEDIVDFVKEKKSIMPNGLQKELTAEELVSLVDYLQTLKKK